MEGLGRGRMGLGIRVGMGLGYHGENEGVGRGWGWLCLPDGEKRKEERGGDGEEEGYILGVCCVLGSLEVCYVK